jgi:hypothetical protein
MTRTPVPSPDRERCFDNSDCAHPQTKGEFAYTKPVLTPVTHRKDADSSPQRHADQDDGSRDDGKLTG